MDEPENGWDGSGAQMPGPFEPFPSPLRAVAQVQQRKGKTSGGARLAMSREPCWSHDCHDMTKAFVGDAF